MRYSNKCYQLDHKEYSFKVLLLDKNHLDEIPETSGVYILNQRIEGPINDLVQPIEVHPSNNLRQSVRNAMSSLKDRYPNGLIVEFFESNDLLQKTNLVANLTTYRNRFDQP